jgi:hypothetical protein
MKIGKAVSIFMQIESDKYTEDEKALAIYRVLRMPTHNSITKDSILKAAHYLWNKLYEIEEEQGI